PRAQMLPNGRALFTFPSRGQYAYRALLSWSFDGQQLFFGTTSQQSESTFSFSTNDTIHIDDLSVFAGHTYDTSTGRISTQKPLTMPGDYPINLTAFGRNYSIRYATNYRYIFYQGVTNQI